MLAEEDQGQCEVLLLHDEVSTLLLVARTGVDVLVFAWVIGGDDSCLVSLGASQQYPAPSTQPLFVAADLPYVSSSVTEAYTARASFLYSPCMLTFVDVLCRDSGARQLPLEHLFEVMVQSLRGALFLSVSVSFANFPKYFVSNFILCAWLHRNLKNGI